MIPRPKFRRWKSGRPDRYLEGDKNYKDNLIPSTGSTFLGMKTNLEPGQIDDRNFTNLKNCFIKDGIIQKAPGYLPFGQTFPLDGICWNVFERENYQGTREIFATTLKSLYKYNNGIWEYLSQNCFTGNQNDILNYDLVFSGTEGEMISIFTNYKDNVKYQVLGKPVTDLFTYWKAKFTKNFKNFQFYGNIHEEGVDYPQRLYWSDIGKPEVVTGSSVVGLQGGINLVKTMGFLTALVPLKAALTIIKDDSISLARYTGNAILPFEFNENVIELGSPAGKTCVNFGEEVLFLGNDLNIYLTDGIDYKNVSKDVRKLLIERINRFEIEKAFAKIVLDNKWYMLFIPTYKNEWNYEVWVLNFEDWTWQFFDCINILNLEFYYDYNLDEYIMMFCDKDGYIYYCPPDVFNKNTDKMESLIDTKDFYWNIDLWKKVIEVKVDCKGSGSLELWYSADEGITWNYVNSVILSLNWDIKTFRLDKICKKIRFRFRSYELNSYFYIRNYNPKRIDKGRII